MIAKEFRIFFSFYGIYSRIGIDTSLIIPIDVESGLILISSHFRAIEMRGIDLHAYSR